MLEPVGDVSSGWIPERLGRHYEAFFKTCFVLKVVEGVSSGPLFPMSRRALQLILVDEIVARTFY